MDLVKYVEVINKDIVVYGFIVVYVSGVEDFLGCYFLVFYLFSLEWFIRIVF